MNISDIVIEWYKKNKRDLPWRGTENPYLIWLSEIILQQTRVNQGMEYYHNFVMKYPDVFSLANAGIDEVLKLWQGLGYYSRARNLHETAKCIVAKYKGIFPDDYNEIIKLKGIGEYTASAIMSFAFNKPYAVIDGNVCRVIARVFGIKKPFAHEKTKKEFRKIAREIINPRLPGIHNQAMMEFGALQCTPGHPGCESCPIKSVCHACKINLVAEFPIKEKKSTARDRYFNYLIIQYKNALFINRREQNDIWKKLYDFPLIECEKSLEPEEFLNLKPLEVLLNTPKTNMLVTKISKIHKHRLSHQNIHARFYHIVIQKESKKLTKNYVKIPIENFKDYAVPKLIDRYMEKKI